MPKRTKNETAGPVENIAQVSASEITAPEQAAVINEVDGDPIFHADEEAGDGDE